MKRVLAFLLAVCLTAPAAWAAEDGPAEAGSGNPAPEVLAGQLQSLGLFLGNDIGDFDLDRAPTRAEAVVMLVRALGKEEEAKTLPTGHPFTDVPEWAEGYVSYAYAQGYTKGISDSLLGAEEPCSAEMYLTFLLRSLGYEEGEEGDFVYHKPFYQAYRAGIFLTCIDFQDFQRSDVVETTAAALFAVDKATGRPLHERLEEAGAFSPEAFAQAFPGDPYAYEKELEKRVDRALDKELNVGQVGRKRVNAQRNMLMRYEEKDDLVSALVLVCEIEAELAPDEGFRSMGRGSACHALTLRADTGALVSYDYLSNESELVLGEVYLEHFAYILDEESMNALDQMAASGEVKYIPPTYDEAVEELRAGFTYYAASERTYETDLCTIFVYDRGGAMYSPHGNVTLIYKAGSPLGEGITVDCPIPSVFGRREPAEVMALSEDQQSFTYSYYYEDRIHAYTVDLAAGETSESESPVTYDSLLTLLTQGVGYTVERRLEGPGCVVVLRWKALHWTDDTRDYRLDVLRPGEAPSVQQLILPSTTLRSDGYYAPTDRAPDSLGFSDDGGALVYTYHFDEALFDGDTMLHDAGTYIYTVDLTTRETGVTLTKD